MFPFKYVSCLLLLNFAINKGHAAIYHLNDTEYERMPPLFALDPYESCLRQTDGVYCLIELGLHEGPDEELMSIIQSYSEHTVKHYNHSYVQRGVCVQKTCEKFVMNRTLNNIAVLNMVLEECLNDTMWKEYGLEARMKLLNYCDKHGDVKHHDISDWVVVGIIAAILIVNLIGSGYNIILKTKNCSEGNKYLLCFSVLRSWKFLTAINSSEPKINRLKGLHGYKSITIFLMFIAHVMWINSMGFTENPHDFEKAYDSIAYQLIFNGMMIIQVFLVQSGFLLSYNLLIRSEKQTITWNMYLQILLMRWWRLTPPYAVMLAITATWLRYLGSGPLWRLWVADSVVADCRRYWWLHLLYVQNYVSDDKFCAIQTWYLGAEMQVFAIGLVVFLVTSQRQSTILFLLVVLGSVIPILQAWFQDLDGIMIMNPEFYRKTVSDTFNAHISGHNYLSCYAIGMGTAFMLYRIQEKGIDQKENKILQFLSWCFFPAMIGLFLTGRGFYADGPRAHLVLRVLWAAGHRLIMSGIVAFSILSLALRFNESNCAMLECPAWVVPGRLSYCIYLVHINFIHVLLGNRAYLAQVSIYNMIIVQLGVVMMSFMAALPLYLLVEAPATSLMKLITSI